MAASNARLGKDEIVIPTGTEREMRELRGAHAANVEDVAHRVQVVNRDGVETTQTLFPARYQKTRAEDDRVALKRALVAGDQPFGRITQSDDDVRWILTKKRELEDFQFDKFFSNIYNLTSPAEKKMAQDIYPEFFQKQQRRIDTWFELAKRLARINLMGVQDKKDLYLLYAFQTKQIKAPPPEFWIPGRANVPSSAEFAPGILNNRQMGGPTVQRQRIGVGAYDRLREGTRSDQVWTNLGGGFGIPAAAAIDALGLRIPGPDGTGIGAGLADFDL